MAFQLFTDTSSGLSKELRKEHNIEYFRMGLIIAGEQYFADLDYEEYSREQLYEWVKDPNVTITTSLVSAQEYTEKCEKYLEKGMDILYIACTDALSGSRGVFELVKKDLEEKYPDRIILSINSCRAEMALGLMCLEAAKLRDEGKNIEDVYQYIQDNKQYFHQVGSIDTLKYLRSYGRVSGAAAFFADTLNIKPLIMADIFGNNYTYQKVHGAQKAMAGCIEYIKKHMVEGVTDVIYIGETMPTEAKAYLKKRIEEELHIKTALSIIDPIVGVCCGPGMYGCWFKGDLVTESGAKK